MPTIVNPSPFRVTCSAINRALDPGERIEVTDAELKLVGALFEVVETGDSTPVVRKQTTGKRKYVRHNQGLVETTSTTTPEVR